MAGERHDRASESLDPASAIGAAPPTDGGFASTQMLPSDPVSDALDTIRLHGALFFLWEPGWPYGVGVADGRQLSRHILPGTERIISYHIVTRGPCWAAIAGESPVRLETGDTLVLPRGDAYKIASTPQYPAPEDGPASIEFFRAMAAGKIPPIVTEGGPGPESNRLICGFLGCSPGPFNPLLSTLPGMMRVPAPAAGEDPLSSLIAFALSEAQQSRGGERCLLLRLSEVMFVEVLRRYLRASPAGGSGWLEGLRHPVVGRALALLHAEVARRWTLDELARRAGASRSALAEHFARLVGTPPMQYLTRWRMQLAANRLRDPSCKIYTAATEVGYESEAAFSRAFKRVAGMTPRAWRDGD